MPHAIVDAWAQHPTLRHITDPMFASLWRWQALAGIETLGLDDETMAPFLAGNARRVFGLESVAA